MAAGFLSYQTVRLQRRLGLYESLILLTIPLVYSMLPLRHKDFFKHVFQVALLLIIDYNVTYSKQMFNIKYIILLYICL